MVTKSEFELSLSKCYRALQLILDKQSLAIPRNYDVWYTYVSGDIKPLVQAIDAHLALHDAVTQDDIDQFYQKFICPIGKLAASEEIGTRICGEVDGMAEKLAFAATRAREYRATLTEASGRLETVDPPGIKQVLASMIASTREMERHSAHLKSSLEETRAQVMHLNEALAALQVETETDALSGLANRKKFDRDLGIAMSAAEDTGTELCLLLGDVDHFKRFNDMHGHQTGDDVLKEVARVLRSNAKDRDLVARYGGEEFALVLPRTNLHGAVAIANRIRSALAATKMPKRPDGTKVAPIAMSFGAARHHTGDTVQEFVGRADCCLYAAKRAGRNCVRAEVEVDTRRNPAVA
jgi:diguanylate cyclase